MKPSDSEHWKSHVLDEIFRAFAASPDLQRVMVFKGARVLNARLGTGRQSLDLDSNLTQEFVDKNPNRDDQRNSLELWISKAVRTHFERLQPVRFGLNSATVIFNPKDQHPRGWNAFIVKLKIDDFSQRIPNLPVLVVDVAAPEQLLETSIRPLSLGDHQVNAYSMERMAGEKLRAFLSSLPTCSAKFGKSGSAVRAKDLYDLSRIRRVHGLDQLAFWTLVGKEFFEACRSRYIDCQGLVTFREQWDVTRTTYGQSAIPKDILFEEAEETLESIVHFFEQSRIIPFQFPLP